MAEQDDGFEIRIKAARVLYQGTHGITMEELSERTGIPKRTLTMYKRDEGWRKELSTKTGQSTPEAIEAGKMFETQQFERQEATEVAEHTPETSVLTEPLPSETDEIIDRHKREWSVPRAMSAEAVRIRNSDPMRAFQAMKAAKITAECLTLVQAGERKAHGIDKPAGDHTIVLERG